MLSTSGGSRCCNMWKWRRRWGCGPCFGTRTQLSESCHLRSACRECRALGKRWSRPIPQWSRTSARRMQTGTRSVRRLSTLPGSSQWQSNQPSLTVCWGSRWFRRRRPSSASRIKRAEVLQLKISDPTIPQIWSLYQRILLFGMDPHYRFHLRLWLKFGCFWSKTDARVPQR